MENENVKYRNMTISLKVAADEKIMLRGCFKLVC